MRALVPAADAHHAIASTGVDIHIAEWLPPSAPSSAVLMVHGTSAHSAYFGRFAELLRGHGFHAFAVDLKGHGRSGGARGVFTLEEMVRNVDDAARFVADGTGLRVVVLGTSQGGEVALHASLFSDTIAAAVCHNLLLSTMFPLNARVRLIQGPLLAALPSHLRIPLRLAFDWRKVSLDPDFMHHFEHDPLAVLSYELGSYRTIFTTPPPVPVASNHKPILVACGERDDIVTPQHCLKCFMAIGGPKEILIMPGATHQLVIDYAVPFAAAVAAFLRRHLAV